MRGFLFGFALFIYLSTSLHAFDIGESLQIHGFASQGFLISSTNNFMANDSTSGTFAFTDVGVNANWAPTDNLRLGAQLYLRNFGDYTEKDVQIDWALIDYQLKDYLGVKLGKVKLPLGLYNEQRDIDFLRPMIFLPQSIYDESRRDLYLAYLGGGLYGNIPTSNWGDVDYHIFLGKTDYPNDSIQQKKTETSLRDAIDRNNAAPPSKQNPLIPSEFHSTHRESDQLYGGALIFNSAQIDLKLGITWMHAVTKIYLNDQSEPAGNNTINSHFVLSAEYGLDDWRLSAEYSEKDRSSEMFGKTTMDGPSQAGYLMLTYSPFDKWTFSVLYDVFYQMKDDKDGSDRPQSPGYYSWRRDFGIGLKYDINDYFTFKAEYHTVDGTAMQMTVFNPDGTKQYWDYFVTKISFNF